MDQTTSSSPGPAPLTLAERRILGVLIEKQKTTPDVYPMSLNGLTVGCNQKSNRDPVMHLTDEEVETTLESLHKRQLVIRVVSGRVDKWKHVLYELWNLDKADLAVLAELFLRGPQTEGELRTRVSRMDPIDDLDKLREILHRLRDRGFVVYLGPEGKRGTVVGHTLLAPDELSALQTRHEQGITLEETAPATAGRSDELAGLRKELADLRLIVTTLTEHVKQLQEALGVAPPA